MERCEVSSWRKVSKEDEDKRYLTIFKTNLYDMQEANGVYGVLTDHLEFLKEEADFSDRQNIELNWMLRRRYSWSPVC